MMAGNHHWLGAGVKVAVLDSIYTASPYVQPVAIKRFVQNEAPTQSHASTVAQVLASTDPLYLGIAPQCELYIAEVIGSLVRGWDSLEESLDWAEAQGCQVINMSFACPTSDPRAERTIQRLDQKGIIFTSSFNPYLHWPHQLSSVIAVGTPHQQGDYDVAVNGESTVWIDGKFVPFLGTSVASARMAGWAACQKQKNPGITRAELLNLTRQSMPAPPSGLGSSSVPSRALRSPI